MLLVNYSAWCFFHRHTDHLESLQMQIPWRLAGVPDLLLVMWLTDHSLSGRDMVFDP